MTSGQPDAPDALLLDEMFSPAIAQLLVVRGIDCHAVAARPLLRSLDDHDVIETALEEGRILATNNVADFEILRRRREADARPVPGFIYTSDERFPRNRAFVGQVADALEAVARRHMVGTYGGVFWLRPLDT
jgi:hypothetical protein